MPRSEDFTQVARRVADIATRTEGEDKRRNPAAVEMGRLGGRARAAKLTPQQRTESARKAAAVKSAKARADKEARESA